MGARMSGERGVGECARFRTGTGGIGREALKRVPT
jgi:hypothetical protein